MLCCLSGCRAYELLRGVAPRLITARAAAPPYLCAPGGPDAAEPEDAGSATSASTTAPLNYNEAEARGFELYQAGEHERAIRMFELAQTLPGAGVDFKREKQGGMVGSAFAPPNPREWAEERFATREQKLIAQYNIACCYAAMGDKRKAVELLRVYVASVDRPLDQVNEMLVDQDLSMLRDELRVLRDELKTDSKPGLFGFAGIKNPLREIADSMGVEWKD